jgi:hypothetical protein
MNGTERQFSEILEARKASGELVDVFYEPLTLKLGHKTTYMPDFMTVRSEDGLVEFWEVKGGLIRDAGRIKLKAAAAKYPFTFHLAQKKSERWTITEIESW